MTAPALLAVAREAVRLARAGGAEEAAADAARTREVETVWRDGALERVQEATSRALSLTLFVDGRYGAVATSDLRPGALAGFIAEAVAMTRVLGRDPFRALPEPSRYAGQAALDLQLEDPGHGGLDADRRRNLAREAGEAARSVPGAERILSVTAAFTDARTESVKVHSNGFEGGRARTSFSLGAEVSVQDDDGRRPEDGAWASARHLADLPGPADLGREAARRTLARLGARKGDSAVLSMAVEGRAAGRLVASLLGPLGGAALQQKRSFLEGRLGTRVGGPLLSLADDPFLPRGLGSRLYDGEGMATRPRPIFEAGVPRTWFLDTYYARKLGLEPTTGGPTNLAWTLGARGPEDLLQGLGEGILVTGFLGGNANATTGDFSFGVQGCRIRSGCRAEPLGEMNIAGNHLEFWTRLVAVGDDPHPWSALRTPTLVFEGVQFAGA